MKVKYAKMENIGRHAKMDARLHDLAIATWQIVLNPDAISKLNFEWDY